MLRPREEWLRSLSEGNVAEPQSNLAVSAGRMHHFGHKLMM